MSTDPLQPPGPAAEVPSDQRPAPTWNTAQRITIFLFIVVGFVLPLPLLFALQPRAGLHSALSVQRELLIKFITAFFIVLATWLACRRQQRPLADYGIPLGWISGARFGEGALWGFATLSAVLLILRVTGHFQVESAGLSGKAFCAYAPAWAVVFFLVAVSEEFGFRGYLLFLLARRAGFWRVAVALSAGFAVAHLSNPGENLLGILQVFTFGLFFCFTIRRTGNLWFAVGFHAFWDWAETFFYGTPDSGLMGEGHFLTSSSSGVSWFTGGSAGPEGSVLAFLLIFVVALLVHLRFPRVLMS